MPIPVRRLFSLPQRRSSCKDLRCYRCGKEKQFSWGARWVIFVGCDLGASTEDNVWAIHPVNSPAAYLNLKRADVRHHPPRACGKDRVKRCLTASDARSVWRPRMSYLSAGVLTPRRE